MKLSMRGCEDLDLMLESVSSLTIEEKVRRKPQSFNKREIEKRIKACFEEIEGGISAYNGSPITGLRGCANRYAKLGG
jgi:hypothetical protein